MQEDLARYSLEYLKNKGADHVEVRFQEVDTQGFVLKNGMPQISSMDSTSGLGIRFLIKNTLGFASLNELKKESIKKILDSALKITLSSSKLNEKVEFSDEKVNKADYKVNQKIKLKDIQPDEKIKYLLDINKSIEKTKVDILGSYISMSEAIVKQLFINSEGSKILSEIPLVGLMYILTIKNKNKSSQRYWEQGASGGYEQIKKWNLMDKMPSEILALNKNLEKGVKLEKGKQDVVVSPEITGIMTHESAGHPTEADRIFGREAAQAGESFITKNSIGERIGSEAVTIVDDPTLDNSYGFYLYDDEGVKAKRKYLYKNGLINEFLHNKETAKIMGIKSNGSSRANAFSTEPIIRMSNTFVLPSKTPEEHLIQEVKKGVYIKSYTEWNIDDIRMNQKYVGAEAYLIENGKLTKPVVHPTLEITTPKLWSSVKLVGNNMDYHAGQCGKGAPMQAIPVYFGGPSMLLKNVYVY